MLIHVELFGSTVAAAGTGVLNGEVGVNHGPYSEPKVAAPWTVGVAAEVAVDAPEELLARTLTRSVDTASASTGTYVAAVAPATAPHAAPVESQRVHWYA